MLTVSLPEVYIPGLYHEKQEQGVPSRPVDEGADADQVGEPGAVYGQHIHVGNHHADEADDLYNTSEWSLIVWFLSLVLSYVLHLISGLQQGSLAVAEGRP